MESDGREAGAHERARFRLGQEITDTHRRMLVGGVFYLVGWLIVGGYGGAFARNPGPALLLAAAFLSLAIARHVVRPPADLVAGRRWLVWNWCVVIATAICWGAASLWAQIDPGFAASHSAVLLCNVALATAVAHNFAMRPALALVAMAFLFLPGVAALWFRDDQQAVAVVLTVYVFYLLLALVRSNREYESRLELDWQLRQQRDSFERLSRLDPLTGIANRRSFQGELARAAERVRSRGESLSLLMLDLDHFKVINDRHGHGVGDDCLVAFARELTTAFGDAFVARLGGEEFAVLLPVRGRIARELAESFRASLASRPLRFGEREVAMTVSIGVGEYQPITGHLPEMLVRHVDRALYRAKDQGRDRVCDTSAEALSL